MASSAQPQTSSAPLRIGKAALRSVRKLEKPRPLKLTNEQLHKHESVELGDELLQRIDFVIKHINNGNFDGTTTAAIRDMHGHLRTHGIQLETKFKDQLDRHFIALRNASRETRLDVASRLRLLEIIELRATGWRYNENVANYYKNKYQEFDHHMPEVIGSSVSSTPTTPLTTPTNTTTSSILFPTIPSANMITHLPASSVLAPGEVLKCSGKFSKPTKIGGKNYYKDEIVIRNSDSGKVMGIKGRRVHMIEEFSDTVISFQRVSQGARDRLVQITGPSEESINRAKALIEETIRRNASPVRERTEQDLYGSESSLTSSNDGDDMGGSNLVTPFRSSTGRKGQHLSHSLSMNDASIGEYQYTVTVGREALKISGSKLDLVRTSKLVLEEFFANDAGRNRRDPMRHDGSVFITTSNQRPLSDIYFTDDANFGGSSDLNPLQQSISSPDVHNVCNGYKMEDGTVRFQRISSSSGSEDETYKDDVFVRSESDEHRYEEIDTSNIQKLVAGPNVTVLRQPLSPGSAKEAFEEVENSANMQVLCAKNRRAHFAKTEQMSEKQRLTYTREFLLDCAQSPYCRVTPKDLPHIMREMPYLLKKTPDIFDPIAYQKQDLSGHFSSHFFPVMRSSSSVMPDYDDDDLV